MIVLEKLPIYPKGVFYIDSFLYLIYRNLRLKIFNLIFAVLLANLTYAESFICNKDVTDGNSRLESLQKSYQNVLTLEADFTQRSYLSALQVEEQSSGRLWLEKPGLMKWHYQQPEEYYYLIKEQTFTQYLPLDQQVTINNFGEVTLSDLPTSFLMGLGELKQDFNLDRACWNSNQEIILSMSPKERKTQDAGLSKLNLLVKKTDSSLIGAQIIDLTDNVTEIKLSELKINQDFKASIFTLNYPNDTFINDNRAK